MKISLPNVSNSVMLRGYQMVLLIAGWTFLSSVTPGILSAQKIILQAEDYQHIFEGAGVSFGLYLGHHYSMPPSGQDEAIRLINKDCNMKYLQDYIGIYPDDDPAYFDRRANYVLAARQYRPEIQLSLVGNIFPDDLRHTITVNGETYDVLNTDDPNIYERLAGWYFELFRGFYERGVEVDILNVVNEPDLDRTFRKYHYGLDGNTQTAVASIFEQAVPKFKEMLLDTNVNTLGMKIPKIMGPSSISPNGCIDYITFFKNEHPAAWEQIDIVSTHQYINGSNNTLFRIIDQLADGKPFHQSEMHAFRGDDLGDLPIDKPLRTTLSLASLFGSAVIGGVEAWYYFENNYPGFYDPPGLIRVAWNASAPIPYKHYYAFKQLTSSQPEFSHVIDRQLIGISDIEATPFRKMDEDTIYLHLSNYKGFARNVALEIRAGTENRKIRAIEVTTTDGSLNAGITMDTTLTVAQDLFTYNMRPYSVNTLKITISPVTVSVKEPSLQNQIRILRSPGFITCRHVDGNPIYGYRLINLNGQELLKHKVQRADEVQIQTNNFPTRIYILELDLGDRSVAEKVLVRNH